MSEPVIGILDENGKIKPKEKFMEEISEAYEKLKETQGPEYFDLFTDPHNHFSPDEVLEQYKFIERKLYIDGEITKDTATPILQRIQFWNSEDAFNDTPVDKRIPIQVYIDSPGGLLTTGFAIVDIIRGSKTPVYTIVTGTAYSCGLFIALAGHKKFALPNATFLFHEGSAVLGGDAHKVVQQANFYNDYQLKQIKDHILKSTNMTRENYKKHMKDDWYFGAKKALEIGAIDKIIEDVNGGIYEDESDESDE